ncbi:MAG: methylenetetrahydrofolate reductase [NAD(P)H] [Rhodospirillales bacterium]|nr:methylenetetrahydrofolate reductase [NAD(P)H] [Rhodospirillales bacterium]
MRNDPSSNIRPSIRNVTSRGVPPANQLSIATPLPKDVNVSFEFFPPAMLNGSGSFWASIERLLPLDPDFVSITYGAGGTTQDRTLDTASALLRGSSTDVAMHLTCAGASKGEVNTTAEQFRATGGKRILALRGDPPKGSDNYEPHPNGYGYAHDLVAGLKRLGNFDISVAAYPESHPESLDAKADMDNLKAKFGAGADRAITQFFFDTDTFMRFLESARKSGVTAPIIPGILPITDFKRTKSFAERCGAKVPKWMDELFEDLDDDLETRRLVAASVAAEQCRALYAQGIENFHFYTLNQADLCYAICHMLGVRPKTTEQKAA